MWTRCHLVQCEQLCRAVGTGRGYGLLFPVLSFPVLSFPVLSFPVLPFQALGSAFLQRQPLAEGLLRVQRAVGLVFALLDAAVIFFWYRFLLIANRRGKSHFHGFSWPGDTRETADISADGVGGF